MPADNRKPAPPALIQRGMTRRVLRALPLPTETALGVAAIHARVGVGVLPTTRIILNRLARCHIATAIALPHVGGAFDQPKVYRRREAAP